MSVGVVTFVYANHGFLRIPRDEIRGAHPQINNSPDHGREVTVVVALSSVSSAWVGILIGRVTSYGVGRHARFEPEDELRLMAIGELMLADLREAIEIDVVWTETDVVGGGAWTRTEGRPQ